MFDFYNDKDLEAVEKLKDFLPKKIFDSHSHLCDQSFMPEIKLTNEVVPFCDLEGYYKTMSKMLCKPDVLRMNIITYPDPSMKFLEKGTRQASDEFLVRELNKDDRNVGETIVLPTDTKDDIEEKLSLHDRIKGLKPYHFYADKEVTWNCGIGEYLPDSAWEVANEKGLAITLHMVKDKALSDPENYEYIIKYAKKYPNVKFILAHAARSFAAWTGIEAIDKLVGIDNIYYDFAAVCESPAMFQIMKKIGTDKCMWATDFPISLDRGKAISYSDTFYWIMDNTNKNTDIPTSRMIGIETLMAVREACIMLDCDKTQIEDIFYNNAMKLWDLHD